MSWLEIANRLGISDTRVMQLHDSAILKIKAALREPEHADIREEFDEGNGALESTKPIRIDSFAYRGKYKKFRAAVTVVFLSLLSILSSASAEQPSEHLALGSPSTPKSDSQKTDFRIEHSQFVVSYNDTTADPNWVAWHLSKEWLGQQERQNDFHADESLPAAWFHTTYSHYAGSGFDSGHQCPSDDRTKTIADNQATFLMTNMVPQAPALNRGTWKSLETHCRQLVNEGNELYIVAGPHGAGGHGTKGFADKLADKRIVVPASCWKVAVILPDKSGNDLARVTTTTKTLAVVMPNVQTIESDWTTYAVTVREVEELTGLDFFSLVPKAVQDVIEIELQKGQ